MRRRPTQRATCGRVAPGQCDVTARMPLWGVVTATAAPILLVAGWTIADRLQPGGFDPVTGTISDLAGADASHRWTSGQRDRFANDLAYRPSLIAVTASSNRSKGEQDPAEWMPPRRSYWCAYLRNWVGVKYRWGLSVDPREKAYLASGLRGCQRAIATPPRAVSSRNEAPPRLRQSVCHDPAALRLRAGRHRTPSPASGMRRTVPRAGGLVGLAVELTGFHPATP